MKPWGSQATVLHFLPPNLPAEQRRWLAGGPGGGKERPWSPHGWGELCGTDAWPTAAATQRLGDALDYSSCGTPGANLCRPRYPNTPHRSFVRTSFGDRALSLLDRQRCKLTRLAPFRVPFTISGGLWPRVNRPDVPLRFSGSGRCCRHAFCLHAPGTLVAQHGPATHQQFPR